VRAADQRHRGTQVVCVARAADGSQAPRRQRRGHAAQLLTSSVVMKRVIAPGETLKLVGGWRYRAAMTESPGPVRDRELYVGAPDPCCGCIRGDAT
jgi:hypothetical protein